MKKFCSPALGESHGCTAIFYRRTTDVAFLCLILALIPQLLGIAMFKNPPNQAALTDLAMYALGVTMGCLLAYMVLEVISPSRRTLGDSARVFHCRLSENQLLLITIIFFMPLLPDSILAFVMSQQEINVRYILLNDPSVRILHVKLIMVLSQIVVMLIWFYIIFVKPKNMWVTAIMFLLILMETFIWASRTEFVLLGFFYLVNSRKIFTRWNLVLGASAFLLVSFYTIYIQGRADLEGYIDSTIFYSIYFAYPVYLHSMIPSVFHDLTIPYVLFGYPVDVIETKVAGLDMIARHLDEIATNSVIGEDINGTIHNQANVLYPHYGFLGFTLGHLGVFTYYTISVSIICILAEKFRRYIFAWRILIFIFIWSSARAFALGVPNNWFFTIFAFIFCLMFMKTESKTKVHSSGHAPK